MASRSATQLALVSGRHVRSFSSALVRSAPPPAQKKVIKPTKGSLIAKRKGLLDGDEAAGGGQGLGNVLSEVTQAPPNLSALPRFDPEVLTPKVLGDVLAFPDQSITAFKALTLPSLIQKEFAYTKRPATVVRALTLDLATLLDTSKKSSSSTSRHLIAGSAGTGKSVALLQSVSYALSTGWIVLYLPSATPLVDSSTPHAYSSAHSIFHQPVYSAQLLQRFATANKSTFSKVKLQQSWTIGDRELKAGEALNTLVGLGKDERVSAIVFEAVMDELATQTSIPVLLAIDDSQGLFATSAYVDPNYRALESFALSVPRVLLSYISNSKSFNTGSILLSYSPLSRNSSPALSKFLAQPEAPTHESEIYETILSGLKVISVPERLSRKEAVGVVKMLQTWRGDRTAVSDQIFLERFVSTDGNPREFTRSLGRNLSN